MTRLGLTPSQTVGPFLRLGLEWTDGPYVVPEGTPGAQWITGTVYDGDGTPVPDALVETWQADPDGRFDHASDPRSRPLARPATQTTSAAPPRGAASPAIPGFRGFGRCPTDDDGRYRILTVEPGPLPSLDGTEAPHLDVTVLARGMLDRVVTRLYFPDQTDLNAADPVLAGIPQQRRHTLLAHSDGAGLRFDIHLQGEGETVFFEL